VNVALAAAPAHYASLVVLRVLQAFGASSVMTLGAGTIADIYEPKFRARAISIFSLGPQLGPILGPVIGGAIIQRATWRWIFGFLGMVRSFCLNVCFDKIVTDMLTLKQFGDYSYSSGCSFVFPKPFVAV
jgi:MFS family permease